MCAFYICVPFKLYRIFICYLDVSSPLVMKVYVTHRLREHAQAVWGMIDRQGAHVYVSGSAQKMPSDVMAALEDVAVQAGGLDKAAAQQYMRRMELHGRYNVETW